MDNSPGVRLDQASELMLSLPLFHGLSRAEFCRAQPVWHRKRVAAGQVLMSEKQAGEIVYVIAEGTVRICVRRGDQQIIIGLRGAGDVLGEMSVLDGDRRSATVITQTECTLFWVSHDDFWNVLWPMPQFSKNLTMLLARRIRHLTGQVEALATLPVQGRLARLMLDLGHEYGRASAFEDAPDAVEIPFRLTQADIASMIAATRVQVNQVLCSWKKRKLIRIHNSHLHVLDEAVLRALAT